jgi:hypothetical protein
LPSGVRPISVSKTLCVTARSLPSSRTSGSSVDGSPPIAIVIEPDDALLPAKLVAASVVAASTAITPTTNATAR